MLKTKNEVSFFANTWDKKPITITLEEFINDIRGKRWEVLVSAYRRLKAEGKEKEAASIKAGMAGITSSCVCRGGHAASNISTLSGALCIDLDHTAERTQEIMQTAASLPYVLAAFTSISGEGVKIIVRVNIAQKAEYARMYAQAVKEIVRATNFAADEQCKDITRLCFASWDPQAYYNAKALPLNTVLPTNTQEADETEPAVANSPYAVTGTDAPSFVDSYLTLYPAVKNHRNNTVFRLCCEAAKRGIDPEKLIPEIIRHLAADDFPVREIESIVRSAYSKERGKNLRMEEELGSQRVKRVTYDPFLTKGEEENSGIADGEVLREQTPTFPDSVFEQIPEFFAECVKHTCDKRERDGLLLASITAVSGILPTVSAWYNRQRSNSNLFCFITAPSGSSKGTLYYGLKLIRHYHRHWEKLNQQKEKEYEVLLEEYEANLRKNKKAGKTEKTLVRPEEPGLHYPHVPSDISKARLMRHIKDNQECGTLLFETEADTLSSARKHDYGDFDDIIRKVFHHERISCSFKVNGRPIYVDYPCMSLFLSGTPAQLNMFIPSMENGLYSRLLTYTYRQQPVWLDVLSEDNGDNEMEKLFETLSMRLNSMALYLKDSPTTVKLTPWQKEKFNRNFSRILADTDLQGDESLLSVVKRHGLMAMRLCMIFSAIDKATMQMNTPVMTCSDEHFRAAMSIVNCCLEHSKLLSTSLKEHSGDVQPLRILNRLDVLLSILPDIFTTEEAMRAGTTLELSPSTVKRMLNKANSLKINKIERGKYQKDQK